MKINKLLTTVILTLTTATLLSACSFTETRDKLVDKIANQIVSRNPDKAPEATTEAVKEEVRYIKNAVPLREEISISTGNEIAELEAGEKVYLLELEDSWAKIRREDGQEGYVMAMQLSEDTVKVVDPKETHWEYTREGLEIEINRHKDHNVVYWVADIYTENPDKDINTAFAGDSYEACMKEKQPVSEQAEAKDAIFAVNGDAVGFRGDGSDGEDFKNPIVIRNGELCYEDSRDIGKMCTLMKNGKLKIFRPGDLGSGKQMVKDGVTDVWWFDTPLVENGEIVDSLYEVKDALGDLAPYTAIGQKNKNNFIFIVVDGRGSNGSPGTTYFGMAELMKKHGAKTAYQLDGGGSSTIWFDGMVLNQPSDGYERPISDIIYVAK